MQRLFTLFTLFTLFAVPFPAHALPFYPADPDAFDRQWYLQRIEAYEAWSRSQGSREITVAVLDTGVDLNHPDIEANLWRNTAESSDGVDNDGNIYIDDVNGWDFVDGDNDPSPNFNEAGARLDAIHHGTLVAGIIGAVGNNGIGGVGLNWNVRLMPLRVLDSRGRGDTVTVQEAIRYAVAKRADIINLSFIGPGFDPALFLTLRDATRKGVLIVAAVGNEGAVGVDLDSEPLYPVCYSGTDGEDVVLGVAALDREDRKPAFSNFGANCVDISAPGVDFYSTQFHEPGRGLRDLFGGGWSGSSMAAPVVSGVAALIKAINPAYGPAEIKELIMASSDPVDSVNTSFKGKLGRGRVNARRALELAASGGVPLSGPSTGVPFILSAPFSASAPTVKLVRTSGAVARTITAYAPTFRGGVRVTSGDLDGDGRAEIITGAGRGGGPHVRIFRADGSVFGGFFAYDPGFRGGVSVAAGDVDGDGVAEIITAPGPGGGPHIRVFRADGSAIGSFFAYERTFRGGVNVAASDVDGDRRADIIVAPGPDNGSTVKVFDLSGRLKESFSTFPATFRGGVSVAAGDVDGDGATEIIVAPMRGASPEVRVYSAQGTWQRAFLAYTPGFLGGVALAVGDTDQDGISEIVTGAGPGGGPHLIIFDGFGRMKQNFFPIDRTFRGGLSVGIIKL